MRVGAMAKRVLWNVAPQVFRRLVNPATPQEFSIGIYGGASPLELDESADIENPVLTRQDVTDEPAAFVADPFTIFEDGQWHMFFEVMSLIDRRGVIALATSVDGRSWSYARTVLREPFHLAYPQVFRWEGQIYMIPDTPTEGILLYRADRFPAQWSRVCRLQDEPVYSDSSLFVHRDRLWMLTCRREGNAGEMSLRLFGAQTLTGPWNEHPQSPVITGDRAITRPAGRVIDYEGRLIRFAQDCSTVYGKQVRAFEITRLDETGYCEREAADHPILRNGTRRWNASGMHHIDAKASSDGQWVAVVDGWHGSAS